MSDTIVLRKVFALDSNSGLFISTGSVLVTNGLGGTVWTDLMSSLLITGGPPVGILPCTLSSFSTIGFNTATSLSTISSEYLQAICSIGGQVTGSIGTSQVNNLGTVGYISTTTLTTYVSNEISTVTQSPCTISSLVPALTQVGYYSYTSTISSTNAFGRSTVAGLGNSGYVSTSGLNSTLDGLGTLGYISTIITPISFQSTVAGLGQSGYVSSTGLRYATNMLGTAANGGYISSLSLQSTVGGLSTFGYVTNSQLTSTTQNLSSQKANIRFDSVSNVTVIGGQNIFTQLTGNLIYVSTFYQSSLIYSGARPGSTLLGNVLNGNDMEFSTAIIRLDALSSFINTTYSKVTIEVYPTLSFSHIGTGASKGVVIPISTMLKSEPGFLLSNTTVTNFFYVGNSSTTYTGNPVNPQSMNNVYTQPIRISIPQGTVLNYATPYTLYHYMPGSVQGGALQNALHDNVITPYYGSTGSIFVSVQNFY